MISVYVYSPNVIQTFEKKEIYTIPTNKKQCIEKGFGVNAVILIDFA